MYSHVCMFIYLNPTSVEGPLWLWSYGSWIYNYLSNQCLHVSPLALWVRIPLQQIFRVIVRVTVFNATFNNISIISWTVAVSFIGGGNRCSQRKPLTYHKSLTNFIIYMYNNWNIVESGVKHRNPNYSPKYLLKCTETPQIFNNLYQSMIGILFYLSLS
jgi:hypothetical protein